jgi:hypothetical protein
MMRALILTLPLALGGCLAVIGYEPTPEEVEALQRGEDPRANEQPRQASGGEPARSVENTRPEPKEQPTGPADGTVLRWLDSATLVIEANARREVVALVGESVRTDLWDEQQALDERMNRWTYGKSIRLNYPRHTETGTTIYRDGEGRLLATIE